MIWFDFRTITLEFETVVGIDKEMISKKYILEAEYANLNSSFLF